ncbi:hypothetical protein ACFE04_002665 [Oxalis oulophora]
MAGVVIGETEAAVGAAAAAVVADSSSKVSRRRKIDLTRPFKFVPHMSAATGSGSASAASTKRLKLDLFPTAQQSGANEAKTALPKMKLKVEEFKTTIEEPCPKVGFTSVCGRRRDMEDAVSIHPNFEKLSSQILHFYGVFDGHGCSHVATKCKDRLHEIVKEEINKLTVTDPNSIDWKSTLERSFHRMDNEVRDSTIAVTQASDCRCELRTPQCDAVGSTAVVAIVTPNKIIVANCGDSRAVMCSNTAVVPLSSDHKPDRPDELRRIQAAGGRVIYWDGPRVLGVLAMSRAIGDNYLKPFVISEPEVVVMDRTDADECMVIASDGLWDVVTNETACGVAKMCVQAQRQSDEETSLDKGCSDASILLTKLALARQSSDNVSVLVVDLKRSPHP